MTCTSVLRKKMEGKQGGRTPTEGRMNEVVVQCTPVVEAMLSVKYYHLITCKSCKLQLESIEAAGRMDG
jgi:hypothetical protein